MEQQSRVRLARALKADRAGNCLCHMPSTALGLSRVPVFPHWGQSAGRTRNDCAQWRPHLGDGRLDGHGMYPGHGGVSSLAGHCGQIIRAEVRAGPAEGSVPPSPHPTPAPASVCPAAQGGVGTELQSLSFLPILTSLGSWHNQLRFLQF